MYDVESTRTHSDESSRTMRQSSQLVSESGLTTPSDGHSSRQSSYPGYGPEATLPEEGTQRSQSPAPSSHSESIDLTGTSSDLWRIPSLPSIRIPKSTEPMAIIN